MTLPAAAAAPAPAVIDRYPARGRSTGQTDGRTPDRYINPAYYVGSVA